MGSKIMRSLEQVTEDMLALPSRSRALLADKLVESLEFDTDPIVEAAWVTIAKQRRDSVRDGSVPTIPSDKPLNR
jgi:Putative addiction module component